MKEQRFEPELGQMCFGAAYGEYELPPFIEAGLQYLFYEVKKIEHNAERQYEYGSDYKTDIFEIHSYCWGDCDCGYEELIEAWDEEHKHTGDCYQTLVDEELISNGWKRSSIYNYILERPKNLSYDLANKLEHRIMEKYCKSLNLSYPLGCAVHCTCDKQKNWIKFQENNPHPSYCSTIIPNFKFQDFEVRWYKYPFRSASMNKKIDANEFSLILDECLNELKRLENRDD